MPPHSHLRRLSAVWPRQPVYFITTCVANRRPLLATPMAHAILRAEWADMKDRHRWMIGRYVVMPDHVHFFVSPMPQTQKSLEVAVGRWKEWTAKRLLAIAATERPVWQRQFFDHVLRSTESRSYKWDYVRNNPVRAGLAVCAADWLYAGSVDFE